KLGRDVAIKLLPRVFTADSGRLARFEREARMLAALNHPHLGAIYGLEDAPLVELARSGWVESVEVDRRCWPVVIHQLLAMSLASDGISPEDAWSHLARVPDFAGIHRAEFDRLINWMLRDGALRL